MEPVIIASKWTIKKWCTCAFKLADNCMSAATCLLSNDRNVRRIDGDYSSFCSVQILLQLC